MDVIYVLLFIQGIVGEMVVYQPQNIISMDVNGTAVITCVSSAISIGIKFSWYYRKWRSSEDLVLVKSCTMDNDPHKYVCKHENNMASLEIYNVQTNDSGYYYCRYYYYIMLALKFGSGTYLSVGDRSTSRSSIHILSHLQPLHPDSSLYLTCVVLGAHNTVHLYWIISGTYHRGRIISKEESDGTWTVMNVISLPKNNWNYGEKVTCEVWIKSSPTKIHWEIPDEDVSHGYVTSNCKSFLIPVVTTGILLLFALSGHLIRILSLRDNKIPRLTGNSNRTEDEVVYSELDINRLTRC